MLASIHRRFHRAAEDGDLAKLQQMVTDGVDPSLYGGEALFRAVQNQHHECVEFLAPLTPWSRTSIITVVTACQNNDVVSVGLLLPHFVPLPDSLLAPHTLLYYASASRNSEVFNSVYEAMPQSAKETASQLLPTVSKWNPEDLLLLRARLEKEALSLALPKAGLFPSPSKKL